MPALGAVVEELTKQVIAIREELVEVHRRMSNVMRQGRVTEIDAEKGLVKVAYAKDINGQDVTSPWIPWTQRAGSQKEWDPPAVGEQVHMFSPDGDISDSSWVHVGGYSDQFAANHNKAGEYKQNVGESTEVLKTGESVTYKTKTFTIEADHIIFKGGRIDHKRKT